MYEIHPFLVNDSHLLMNIEKACFAHPWSDLTIEALFNERTRLLLGLWVDDMLLAYGIFSSVYEESECERIGTKPEARGQGYAKAIMMKAMQILKEQGIQTLLLEVHENNKAAQHLYQSLGMIQIAERKAYYDDGGKALIYRKEGL